jgi:6-phosphogluconolactonase
MKAKSTRFGDIVIGSTELLFARLAAEISMAGMANPTPATIALTGGGTPLAFYTWLKEQDPSITTGWDTLHWTVSDERCVPLASDQSNFGNAERGLLDRLKVPVSQRHPLFVEGNPTEVAEQHNEAIRAGRALGKMALAVFGMGEDCHTASLFPRSSLLLSNPTEIFAAVNVPDKGWRITLTPAGIAHCPVRIVLVTGLSKATALKCVLEEAQDVCSKPIQLFRDLPRKTLWLINAEAASLLMDSFDMGSINVF